VWLLAVGMASVAASCSEQSIISPSVLAKINLNSWVDSDFGSTANEFLHDEEEESIFASAVDTETTYEQGVKNFFNELAAALDEGDLCANHLGLNGVIVTLAQTSKQHLELSGSRKAEGSSCTQENQEADKLVDFQVEQMGGVSELDCIH